MVDCVIIGGGLAGMAAAWQIGRQGYSVVLIEKNQVLGGLASSFEKDGRIYPLGYHHILASDDHLIAFLGRLGLLSKVEWTDVQMAFSIDGSLHTMSGLQDLFRFPLAAVDKVRMAALIASAWLPDEDVDPGAGAWVRRIGGERLCTDLFDPLTQIKFGAPCDALSAAWLRARLRARESASKYGYIPNGDWVQQLIAGLEAQLVATGVDIRRGQAVTSFVLDHARKRVEGVQITSGETIEARQCISTLAPPLFTRLMPEYPDQAMGKIRYTGVISTVLTTTEDLPLSDYWTNFLRPSFSFGGVFRLDLLNPTLAAPGDRVLNFCTHVRDRGPGSLLQQPVTKIEERYLADFESRFGVRIQPNWIHTSQIPYYSPVFSRGYQNPPERSPTLDNLRFAGNFRTFPVLATTGSAMGSGWTTGQSVCQALDAKLHVDEEAA